MKFQIKTIITLLFCSLPLPIFAVNVTPATSVPFSPYADFTINTHWDSRYQDMEPMDLATIASANTIKSYHLAFITDAGRCDPAWGGQSTYSVNTGWGQHMTNQLRSHGIHYIIAFGGASGNDLSAACSNAELTAVFEKVITLYQPQGLDFDIENGTANVAKMMASIKQVQQVHPELPISFTLPVMPEGLTPMGETVIKQAKSAALKYTVNIMAMDYGPGYVEAMGNYAIQAATSLFHFLKNLYPTQTDSAIWKMVEVTAMIGVNDVNAEQFTLVDADTLRNFADQNNIGGLALWSIARDNPCPDKWASPICSGNSLQTISYEFSQRFIQVK